MDINSKNIVDLIGVGVGPFNLSLAALLNPIDSKSSLFFDANDSFDWHPGLLFEDATLQVPMMADLVTMADPKNEFSYFNYLHETNRLYQFYFHEDFFIPRIDYNQYCQWASKKMNNIHFGHEVMSISEHDDIYKVEIHEKSTQETKTYYSRHIVLGTGTVPITPKGLENTTENEHCINAAHYLENKKDLLNAKIITVVGSGQTAAEVILDLLNDQDRFDYEINWLTLSEGFLPMEYSKLGLEHFSPDYIDHYYSLDSTTRDHVRSSQDLWYKGISEKTIADIYDKIYRRSFCSNPAKITIQANSELLSLSPVDKTLQLNFRHTDLKQNFQVTTDKLVLATGHQYILPKCLKPILPLLKFDAKQRLMINRDYSVVTQADLTGKIYIQNGEIHTHGIAAPDLGLGAYRASNIINSLLNEEHYKQTNKNVFQNFGIAQKWQTNTSSIANTA